jgi:hypothetical protein
LHLLRYNGDARLSYRQMLLSSPKGSEASMMTPLHVTASPGLLARSSMARPIRGPVAPLGVTGECEKEAVTTAAWHAAQSAAAALTMAP